MAKIRLRGPKEPEDLKLLFALASGAIAPPKGALWEPEHWFDYPGGPDAQTRLQRGLFSPFAIYQPSEDRSKMPFDKLMAMLGQGTTPGPQNAAIPNFGAGTSSGIGPAVGALANVDNVPFSYAKR